MSTRGIIARKTKDGWEGRYHHFDSYPEGLGADLYKLYNEVFGCDSEKMLKVLIDDHPAGWSTISGDWTKPSGYDENITSESLYGPRCYCHGDRHEEPYLITNKSNLSGLEYLYVIDKDEMDVFTIGADGKPWFKQKINLKDQGVTW